MQKMVSLVKLQQSCRTGNEASLGILYDDFMFLSKEYRII